LSKNSGIFCVVGRETLTESEKMLAAANRFGVECAGANVVKVRVFWLKKPFARLIARQELMIWMFCVVVGVGGFLGFGCYFGFV
jgi:hypothetical protein